MNSNLITNFRDIGGYRASDGEIEKGFFFRSGQLNNLDDEQVSFLKDECKLKTIYDFRSQSEVDKDEDTPISGVEYQHLDILASLQDGGAASLEGMFSDLNNIDSAMYKTYEEIVLSDSAQNGYHKFMQDLVDDKKPVIFHCFAGKDRTGWAAYLILKVSGVSDDDIMKDYLKTNELRKDANDEIINQFKDKLNDQQLTGLESALTVKAEYLNYAIKTMNEKFGSFENYLVEGLNLAEDYKNKFIELYIEK